METSDIAPHEATALGMPVVMVLAVHSLSFSFLDHTELLNSTNFQLITVFNNILGDKFLHRAIQSNLAFFGWILSGQSIRFALAPEVSFPQFSLGNKHASHFMLYLQ